MKLYCHRQLSSSNSIRKYSSTCLRAARSGQVELGYSLSSEEHGPTQPVEQAWRAEEAGFSFAVISDHFHPWVPAQGQSPFVWSVLGGIARETDRMRMGTGVTCPVIRMHPATAGHRPQSAWRCWRRPYG